MNKILLLLLIVVLAGCQTLREGMVVHRPASPIAADSAALFSGQFDNHEQVWSAREHAPSAMMPPHVIVNLAATKDPAWSTWHIELDATASLDALWAMQRVVAADGSLSLLPYRALVAGAGIGAAFDAKQWTPLDACALRGEVGASRVHVAAEPIACAALAPGVGPQAALLPLAIEREGEWLHVRLFTDQARGADVREDARKVETYTGWAAINGAGPQGAADGKDWHMDRSLHLGSEGGRTPLTWRDGKASGYSLRLERLTYGDDNVAVLKLSLVEDQSDRTLAYAWANPEATRIGLSVGWVQVGLERAITPATGKR
ncbi:MAG: hypothetical protein ABJB02_01930 [Dokdonella sp.]